MQSASLFHSPVPINSSYCTRVLFVVMSFFTTFVDDPGYGVDAPGPIELTTFERDEGSSAVPALTVLSTQYYHMPGGSSGRFDYFFVTPCALRRFNDHSGWPC